MPSTRFLPRTFHGEAVFRRGLAATLGVYRPPRILQRERRFAATRNRPLRRETRRSIGRSERLKPFLLQRDPSGLRFAMSNALKDMGYYVTMAGDSGSARAIAEGVRDTFDRGTQEGSPETLVPELVALLAAAGDGSSRTH